jgi:Zn-finger nucleic acid-binding protein
MEQKAIELVGKQVLCPVCDGVYAHRASLNRHIATVHEQKRAFKCTHCDFSCSQKYNLQSHTCMKRANADGKIQFEHEIQKKLQEETKGHIQHCPIGAIDILTETQIIEIKVWSDYFKAIGQILLYATFYPEKQKRMHFFGAKPKQEIITAIETLCEQQNILLTYE